MPEKFSDLISENAGKKRKREKICKMLSLLRAWRSSSDAMGTKVQKVRLPLLLLPIQVAKFMNHLRP